MPSYSSSKCAERRGCVGFLWVPGGQAESYMLFAGRQLQQYCEVCAVGTQRLQQHPQVLAGGLTLEICALTSHFTFRSIP